MSFISTGVEYGLHCLLSLTTPSEGRPEATVRDLATFQGVPNEYLAKLFTKLTKAGLVVATEGSRGGFALARAAGQISFLDVVEAIDGKKPLFECREIRTRCAVFGSEAPEWATAGVCSIHEVMLAAEKRMRDELASHSLAELCSRVATKAPVEFGAQVSNWFEGRMASRHGSCGATAQGKESEKQSRGHDPGNLCLGTSE
jgi:Rrf2 family protein